MQNITAPLIRTYSINWNTYLIEPVEYNGRQISKVYDKYGVFYVDKKPMKRINDTFRKLGTTYKASVEYSKEFLGDVYKPPIIMFYDHPYTVIPLFSPKTSKCIWIALHPILSAKQLCNGLKITFTNQAEVIIPMSYMALTNRYFVASTLCKKVLLQRNAIEKEINLQNVNETKRFFNP